MKRRIKELLLITGSVILFCGCQTEEEKWLFSTEEEELVDGGAIVRQEESIQKILVYVCGAVNEPGVVEVEHNARVIDAIDLAGGVTQEADETYLNLAGKLQDGEKIYVPTVAEVSQWRESEKSSQLININTAGVEELCKLPGIGQSKAEDIISYREKHGSFQTKEELMKVSGIKENLYDKIEDKITVK